MMLSVIQTTKSPVKFWFLKNYLSPNFKVCVFFLHHWQRNSLLYDLYLIIVYVFVALTCWIDLFLTCALSFPTNHFISTTFVFDCHLHLSRAVCETCWPEFFLQMLPSVIDDDDDDDDDVGCEFKNLWWKIFSGKFPVIYSILSGNLSKNVFALYILILIVCFQVQHCKVSL